jgi:ubiquinone/menaquinone biosynthesis C-methylase UbiE
MPPRRVRLVGRTVSGLVAHAPWLWRLIRAPVQRFWDRAAARWDANETPNRTNSLRTALPQMGNPERILEIGTGTGSGAGILKASFPESEVTGVDLSPEMIRIAQAKVPGVTFEPADAARLPFPDASFDLVTQNNVPVYFDELVRVTAPGGRVLITSTLGPATPYYTPHNVLRRHFGKLGFTDLRSEQSPPGDWFTACKPS